MSSTFPTELSEQQVLNKVFDPTTNTLTTSGPSGSGSTSGTSTLSNVSPTSSSTSVLASNTNRKQYIAYNDGAVDVYIKNGSSATTTSFTVKLVPGATYIEDKYSGAVTAVTASGTGTLRVTEVG